MKMLILGAGESGTGAAQLGRKLGYDVYVSDSGRIGDKYRSRIQKCGAKWEENGHTESFLAGAELVVKSPGIPSGIPLVQGFRQKGIEVISEIEFASRHTTGEIIAITGTNGKTTTTLLTYHIFAKAGLDVAVGGNMGTSFAGILATTDHDIFVLEVSSFQLDDIVRFRPNVAVITNITPDHLDRYSNDMGLYIESKFAITRNQSAQDHFIYCADDPILSAETERRNTIARKHPVSISRKVNDGAYLDDEKLIINLTNKPFEMSIHDLALQGKHNAYNSMAAGVAARIFEIRKEVVRESLSDFQNAEHRLEFVADIHGIRFINDSKATNVNSTWYALESLEGQVVWIVGGVDKGNDYAMLDELVRQKVKAVICLGKDNLKLLNHFAEMVPQVVEASSAEEAVNLSYRLARKGDTVILSPACASFDLFDNYEDRGHKFKMAVKSL